MPIFAFCGTQDAVLTRDELDAWREQTTARFTLDCFPGASIFLSSPAAGHVAAFEPEMLRSTVAKRALGCWPTMGVPMSDGASVDIRRDALVRRQLSFDKSNELAAPAGGTRRFSGSGYRPAFSNENASLENRLPAIYPVTLSPRTHRNRIDGVQP